MHKTQGELGPNAYSTPRTYHGMTSGQARHCPCLCMPFEEDLVSNMFSIKLSGPKPRYTGTPCGENASNENLYHLGVYMQNAHDKSMHTRLPNMCLLHTPRCTPMGCQRERNIAHARCLQVTCVQCLPQHSHPQAPQHHAPAT